MQTFIGLGPPIFDGKDEGDLGGRNLILPGILNINYRGKERGPWS